MGSLFGSEKEFQPAFFLDFRSAEPTAEEEQIFNNVQLVVTNNTTIVDGMRNYFGCTKLIQQAISNPTEENKRECWNMLSPTVDCLKEYYIHGEEVGRVFPLVLEKLCSSGDPEVTFSKWQALTKQLALIIDFAMCYDELKMNNPAVPNDFSYYRRTMSAMKMSGQSDKINVTDEMANKMSLFYAFPTPMLNIIKDCVQKENNMDKNAIINGLSLMANVCYNLVHSNKFDDVQINIMCLRAAVGATIIVDCLYEPGILHPKAKKPPIIGKYALLVLKSYPHQQLTTTMLINSLRYNTKDADQKLFEGL